jgi:hypothetical protein
VPPRRSRRVGALAAVVALSLAAACTSGARPGGDAAPSTTTTTTTPGDGLDRGSDGGSGSGAGGSGGGAGSGSGEDEGLPGVIVLATHGGALDAYDGSAEPGTGPVEAHRLHPADGTGAGGDPGGDGSMALSGQVCVAPDGTRRIVTAADDPTTGPGWAVLELTGQTLGTLAAEPAATFAPTYAANGPARPYGCAFLPDGRLLTTDRGAGSSPDGSTGAAPSTEGQAGAGPSIEGSAGTGQLVLWFPPFVDDQGRPRACKVATDLAEPGGIWVDDQDRALVAATSGIWRFSGPWPSGPSAAEGCDGVDATGAPAQARPRAELLVPAGTQGTGVPGTVAGGPGGDLFVTSPLDGVVTQHDVNGTYRRTILSPSPSSAPAPEAGDGDRPTPVGLAVGPDRTVFLLLGTRGEAGSGPGLISRLPLVDGLDLPPDVLAEPVTAPSGIGLAVPTAAPGPASKV